MSDRTYSEREVSDLISRAVERQQDASRRRSEVGLTLAEVERIGRETGIDPEHLRAAASEMDSAGRTLSRQATTTDRHVAVERWIDAPLSPEGWEDAVSHLRSEFGLSMSAGMSAGGTVQQIGNAYEWQHTSALGVQTTVTASPRDGRTRLRMRQLVGLASPTKEGVGYGVFPAAFFGMLGAAGGAAMTDSLVLILLAGLVAFIVAWAIATPVIAHLDRQWRAKKLRALDALADDLSDFLATPMPGSPELTRDPEAPRLGAGVLDARLLDDDSTEAGDVTPSRRVRD